MSTPRRLSRAVCPLKHLLFTAPANVFIPLSLKSGGTGVTAGLTGNCAEAGTDFVVNEIAVDVDNVVEVAGEADVVLMVVVVVVEETMSTRSKS